MTKHNNSFYEDGLSSRYIGKVNWIGVTTLIRREVGRFVKVYSQTIVAPVVTTLLFYAVFALAFGGLGKIVNDVPFLQFLAPGLVMMTMAQNSFANTSSSLIIAKIQGNIIDVLMPPLSNIEIFIGFLIGGIARGLCVGFVGIFIIGLFVDLPITSIITILSFALLGTTMMATMGVLAGIWAEKFDHIAAFTNFFVTPLTFLSGTFYSIEVLPNAWKSLAMFNPFYYMIDGFRSGFLGHANDTFLYGVMFLFVTNIALITITYRMIKSGYKIKS